MFSTTVVSPSGIATCDDEVSEIGANMKNLRTVNLCLANFVFALLLKRNVLRKIAGLAS